MEVVLLFLSGVLSFYLYRLSKTALAKKFAPHHKALAGILTALILYGADNTYFFLHDRIGGSDVLDSFLYGLGLLAIVVLFFSVLRGCYSLVLKMFKDEKAA